MHDAIPLPSQSVTLVVLRLALVLPSLLSAISVLPFASDCHLRVISVVRTRRATVQGERHIATIVFCWRRITRTSASQSGGMRRVTRLNRSPCNIEQWAQKHFLWTTKGADPLNPPFEVDSCWKFCGKTHQSIQSTFSLVKQTP